MTDETVKIGGMQTLQVRVKDKHASLLPSRVCNVCQESKPRGAFSADRRNISGLQSRCKPCAANIAKQWREANHARQLATRQQWEARNPERHLRSKFGIRVEDKRAIFANQGHACGACGSAEHRHPRLSGDSGWCLDHCHSSGTIRGVLCWRCNLALGYAEDSPEKLRALAVYLTLRCYMGNTCAQATVPGGAAVYIEEMNHADPLAATRRAIFRAAAAIGDAHVKQERGSGR